MPEAGLGVVLIASCPHLEHKAGVWRVSARVDERKDSRRDLVGLADRPVLEPSEAKFLPSLVSLRWREKQLTQVN